MFLMNIIHANEKDALVDASDSLVCEEKESISERFDEYLMD